ncbi:MAG TPA: amidohydrolase family protein [Candidatus Polarisedimenticolaceae bacterium]|nr:amidohydrolase family protein [Candidatus Polarisedimenticolaceae bacterium]
MRPLKIDVHTHVLPRSWPDLAERYGYPGFVRLEHDGPDRARMMREGECFRVIESNCWSAERRLEECDRTGVDVQVLSTVPVMFSYWARPEHALDLSALLNDHIAELVSRHPRRFAGLATVPLQDPERAIAELERAVGQLGMCGVQIGSHVNDWELDQPELLPFFRRAAELGAAVFVHPWEMLAAERMSRYWLRWLVGMPAETTLAICSMIFGGVLERLPRLRVGFAHGGGSFPATVGRIQHGFEVRPDLCAVRNDVSPADYLRRIYYDSLVHRADALHYLIRTVGVDRIFLGSDYPFPLGERLPGALIERLEGIDETDRVRLLSGTALEFLGREVADFG